VALELLHVGAREHALDALVPLAGSRTRRSLTVCSQCTSVPYAYRVGGSNEDGAWRGLVTIVELIDLRPYILQPAVYGRLICTVIYLSDRLLTQANLNPRVTPPPDLRSPYTATHPPLPHPRWTYTRYRGSSTAELPPLSRIQVRMTRVLLTV